MHVNTPQRLQRMLEEHGISNVKIEWATPNYVRLQITMPEGANQIRNSDFMQGVLATLEALGCSYIVIPAK